ncbi:MAG: DUF2757 family protein [Alicyclobacillaceae bacterium]|nr:DUF2757 family protein [Alicyclobacillaceae bacterium]
MRIIYVCRHCRHYLGEVDGKRVSLSALGFHSLTPEERADIITLDPREGWTYVNTVCEFCQQALEANPELSLIHSPLQ